MQVFTASEKGWAPYFTVRSASEPEFEFAQSQLGFSTRERNEWSGPVLQPDGSVKRVRVIEPVRRSEPGRRPPMGEMDRDFLGMDLSMVEYHAQGWDEIAEEIRPGENRVVRISEFHDLIGHMRPIANDPTIEPRIKWNKTMTEDHEWIDALWTWQQLAERWGRFQWNDDFYAKRRVPWHAQVGWVHQGRFVYLGEGVFATLVVKSLDHVEERVSRGKKRLIPVWRYTVFWRESLGFETKQIRGVDRTVRVWVYHYAKTFANLGGPHLFDREGATAFADRLEAKAILEAELVNETRRSMGQFVPETWDRDEFPYEPALLDALRYGASDSD